jgi:hypothetical protein
VRADPTGAGLPSGAPVPQLPQIGGPNTLIGLGDPSNGKTPDKYGLHPRLKRLFRMNTPTQSGPVPPSYYYPQMGYNQGGPAYNPTGYPTGAYGPAQGTLAFPNQPFIRSPRDFFMIDTNK